MAALMLVALAALVTAGGSDEQEVRATAAGDTMPIRAVFDRDSSPTGSTT